MAKRIMALLLCLTMMILLTQSVFASSNSFGNLENLNGNNDDDPVEGSTSWNDESDTIEDLYVEYDPELGTLMDEEEIPDEEPAASESTVDRRSDPDYDPDPVEGGDSSEESNPVTGVVLPLMMSALSLGAVVSSKKHK